MIPRHGDPYPGTTKRVSLQRSGFCQTDHHQTCKWFPHYETPSVIIVCSCDCHATTERVMVPKGQTVDPASSRVIVPKK